MAVQNTTPVTKTLETTVSRQTFNGSSSEVITVTETVKQIATFNGKVYNGKRYINVKSASSTKQITVVWQDGFGWADKRDGRYAFSDLIVEAFGLE